MAQRPEVAQWVLPRLKRTIPEPDGLPLRFESWLHGPLTAFFTAVFPAVRLFMVAPQLILIKAEPDNGDSSLYVEDGSFSLGDGYAVDDPLKLSTDNLGTFIPGRDLGRLTKGQYLVPDFMILKVPESGDAKNDRLVAIIEIKKNGEDAWDARQQLYLYMEAALDKRLGNNVSQYFRGYLILGRKTEVLDIDPESGKPRNVMSVETAEVDGLLRELQDLAEKEW